MARRHILILGGTAEARAIAGRLAGDARLRVTSSLAGRTESPVLPAGEVRIGGFGGPSGLAGWMRGHDVDLLVDATHPFAARISANAVEAASLAGTPLVVHDRPAWERRDGDVWIETGGAEEAAEALGRMPRRVFLAVGRQELGPFDARRWHRYVVRSVDAVPDGILPDAIRLNERGPFVEAAERTILEAHGIDLMVAKNSGGAATYAKIAAARALEIPVIMIRRPAPPAAGSVHSVAAAVEAIHRTLAILDERGA